MRFVRVTGRGHSMWPACRDGDILLARQTHSPPHVGEIWLVRMGAQLVAHRIVHIDTDGREARVLCRGDAGRLDPPVTMSALVAKVVLIERRGALLPVPAATPLSLLARLLLRGRRFVYTLGDNPAWTEVLP